MAVGDEHYMVLTMTEFLNVLPQEPDIPVRKGRASTIPDWNEQEREFSRTARQWDNVLNQMALEGWFYHSSHSPGLLIFERRPGQE